MKNKTIKSISIILIVILMSFYLFSCDLGIYYPESGLPDGFTGGFGIQPGSGVEYYWVETYEECIEAIELLKLNGSTFLDDAILTYEGNNIDIKYCFKFHGDQEKITYGENPYNRKATVSISVYVFFEEVSIENINYSLIRDYDAYSIEISEFYKHAVNDITNESIQYGDWETRNNRYIRKIYFGKEELLTIQSSFFGEKEISFTDEFVDVFLWECKIVELN